MRKTCVEKMGVTFDPWQDAVGKIILAKREDGTLASMIDGVGMSFPRQVGKTYLLAALIFGLCINQPGLLVIWTAHHLKTSGETFLAMQSFAQRPKVAPHVLRAFTGSGDEEVRFHNGSRILFGARERGFGRGIPGVDVLIFDEAQILSDRALSNMLATMNTSRFGLQLYIGTPPKPEDMSESFKRMRREALAGTLADGAWVEFGADPDADDDDRAQWRRANPSYPRRTPAQSMLRLRRKLADADWRREGLGIWDSDQTGSRLITEAQWSATGVETAPPRGRVAYAVAYSLDGSRVALAAARVAGDAVHVEVIDGMTGATESGTSALAEWLEARWRSSLGIVVAGAAGETLVQRLRDAKVGRRKLHRASTPDYLAACSLLYGAVTESAARVEAGEPPSFTHLSTAGFERLAQESGVERWSDPLGESVAVCDKKKRGSAWGWQATTPGGDETPIEAASLAYWLARTARKSSSTGEGVSFA